jgi:uncharacterized membrane protein
MNQVENFGGAAKQLVHTVHEVAVGSGLAPVPTMIILGLAAMFALVGMVVGGRARGRVPRHSHRA